MKVLLALMLVVPRYSFSYAIYLAAPMLLLGFKQKPFVYSIFVTTLLVIAVCFSSIFSLVSPTSFVLEYFLCLPLFLVLCGFNNKYPFEYSLYVVRLVNFGVFILSIYNMVLYGFPISLPYVDFLPDIYGALYGLGGAKIVTVIGIFSVLMEIRNDDSVKPSKWLALAFFNFIFPNYIIGIACGMLALGVWFIKTGKDFFYALIIVFILLAYLLERLGSVDSSVILEFGYHPKVLSFLNTFDLFSRFPQLTFSGTGLGQYTSVAALWSNDYFREISTQGIPDLPGFYMSNYQNYGLGDVLSYFQGNAWALSSSSNKPYSSFSTLLAETGLFGLFAVMYFLCKRVFESLGLTRISLSVICLLFSLFLLDSWHDSPWVAFMLLMVMAKENDK